MQELKELKESSPEAKVFENTEFGRLTVVMQAGNPWFIAKEVSDFLGYSESAAMTRRLRDKDKDLIPEFMIDFMIQHDSIKSTENSLAMAAVTAGVSENSLSRKYSSSNKYGSSMKEMTLITEAALYDAIFGSKKPEAQRFKYWVCDEVLPSIRQHGMYATEQTIDDLLDDPDLMIKTLTRLKEEKEARRYYNLYR